MMKRMGVLGVAMAALAAAGLFAGAGHGQDAGIADAPQFTAKGELVFPQAYRRWVFLTSGHGMSYSEQAAGATDLPFDNVFVNPTAHAAFLKTGHWPRGHGDGARDPRRRARKGRSTGTAPSSRARRSGLEVHVRDSKRFKDGWGFFGFDDASKPAAMIGYSASCYSCHQAHAAVDTSFVQFYPTLLPVAREKGTLSAAYRAEEAGTGG